jgi:ornithine cyclodeaminase/alanine dehydrogenase-like protein (mu-crystallin family)
MLHLNDEAVAATLDWPSLVAALRGGFQKGAESPARPHYSVSVPGERDATLLLMPAWTTGGYLGLKTVTVFPDNGLRSLPAVSSHYLLMSARDGQIVASLEAGELTSRRTAAASALASSYLSRPDASRLLIVGAGRMAPNLALAHASVRPIESVEIWARDMAKAERLARELEVAGLAATAVPALEAAVSSADIISCATLSEEPLVLGQWLRPGCHLDLVGAFTPTMREADDEALQRASIFVDTLAGAAREAGEIVQALACGAIASGEIRGDLFDLTSERVIGRQRADEITLFKSVGCSLEDLVAAELCYERSRVGTSA